MAQPNMMNGQTSSDYGDPPNRKQKTNNLSRKPSNSEYVSVNATNILKDFDIAKDVNPLIASRDS